MLSTAFSFQVHNSVVPGVVCSGRFDGQKPSLALATRAGKLLLHSPHAVEQGGEALRLLNINREVKSVCAGPLESEGGKDVLLLGTSSNLMAYDVDRNADSFFLEQPDGANVVLLGQAKGLAEKLVLVGGDCSVYGYDKAGVEKFWTVTGDNVSAMALCDAFSTGEPNLLVGSEDFAIRVFDGEEMVSEITEAEKVTHLTPAGRNR
eukprot:scaffold635_cov311-Pinguiococcus_pyrenoidosus.AAC.16